MWTRPCRRRAVCAAAALVTLAAVGAVALVLANRGTPSRASLVQAERPMGDTAGGGQTERARQCEDPVRALSFVSHRAPGGAAEIYRLQLDRPRRVERVSAVRGFAVDPHWSPDGRRLAFRWLDPQNGSVGVFVADADGSDVRRLAADTGTPSWSPDGRYIAYASLRAATHGISIADVERALAGDTSAHRVVTKAPVTVPEEYPDWSPDGRKLAFTSHRDGDSDIWVVDADGNNLHNLTPGLPSLENKPSWSPDGSTIAFGLRATHRASRRRRSAATSI